MGFSNEITSSTDNKSYGGGLFWDNVIFKQLIFMA